MASASCMPTCWGLRRIGLPIVKLHCEFSAISRMGDDVQLKLTLERAGQCIPVAGARLLGGDEQRVVACSRCWCSTDLNTYRAIAVPPDVREALAASVEQ